MQDRIAGSFIQVKQQAHWWSNRAGVCLKQAARWKSCDRGHPQCAYQEMALQNEICPGAKPIEPVLQQAGSPQAGSGYYWSGGFI